MSVASAGASGSAYSYLRSMLQQQDAAGGNALDPVSQLLAAFYPGGAAGQTSSAAATGTGGAPAVSASTGLGSVGFSPDTLASLIAIQGQQSSPDTAAATSAQAALGASDVNGDGQIDNSGLASTPGSNAADNNGGANQGEPTSAATQSHAHHHHHHAQTAGTDPNSAQSGLAALLSSTDLAGATTQTSSNADGSTTTTVTYADGSTVSATTPASSGAGDSTGTADNLIKQLIRLQAQMLNGSGNQAVAAA